MIHASMFIKDLATKLLSCGTIQEGNNVKTIVQKVSKEVNIALHVKRKVNTSRATEWDVLLYGSFSYKLGCFLCVKLLLILFDMLH